MYTTKTCTHDKQLLSQHVQYGTKANFLAQAVPNPSAHECNSACCPQVCLQKITA
jgi:hypothetical protein